MCPSGAESEAPTSPHRRGGNQEARDILESKCVFVFIYVVSKSNAGDNFHVDGRDMITEDTPLEPVP